MNHHNQILFLFFKVIFVLLWINSSGLKAESSLEDIFQNFKNPPMDCWPHTRWWWPGNPVSKEEITWELEQMRAAGIRGVEQITMSPVYQRVDIPYLSKEFFDMVKHTVNEAKRLDMEVSINFGGPGWIIGGDWVKEEDKSKDLLPTSIDLVGPQKFKGRLPNKLSKTQRSWEIYEPYLTGEEKLLAVVAGKIVNNRIDPQTLTVLSSEVKNNFLNWEIPQGDWRIMAFWLAKNGSANAVDHFSQEAMEAYCDYFGEKFKEVIGKEFGKTVDSFFCDSFELPNLASGIYWSTDLLVKFKEYNGYDLTPYLPAIWWEVGDISPKIRYDVNKFLHRIGMEVFFETFLGWCEDNGINGRVQTYGFTTDNIEAAGRTHIPEMEITPGEKDSAPWFDTRIGPKKYVASGAHIYGRPVVSVEAYTFLHWERYRSTLEELKIATDGFLRAGATKFYNHGYSFLPERDLAPTRRTPWAPQINPSNVWWKYYPLLTQYIARCCYLLRQGEFAPDIAIYSPLANQWTKDVLNPRKWTREFDWGELGFLLISNGYDFDLLNDDALLNIARFDRETVKIRNMEYKMLLLPNIESLPLETMECIQHFVMGGGVVIALDRIPEFSTGLKDYQIKDKTVQEIVKKMFKEPFGRDEVGSVEYGGGHTYFIKNVIDRKIWWDQRSSTLDPFLNTIRENLPPDFQIDFAHEGIRSNQGLTFLHRKLENADIYFVTNIQDRESKIPVTFRSKGNKITYLNPYTGEQAPWFCYQKTDTGTKIPLHLAPYESIFIIFEDGEQRIHVKETNLDKIEWINENTVSGLTSKNGYHYAFVRHGDSIDTLSIEIQKIPAPFMVTGNWKMSLIGKDFPKLEKQLTSLESWTQDSATRHFSGTGQYKITFNLPEFYVAPDFRLLLDLGKVGNVAEVNLNHKPVGTVWIRGQLLNITTAIESGQNEMTIEVTNTNINRVSAFIEPPPVPADLVARFGEAPQISEMPVEFGFKSLPASGLMGPVKVIPQKRVHIVF